jgi:hypothetical protein
VAATAALAPAFLFLTTLFLMDNCTRSTQRSRSEVKGEISASR